MTQPSQERLHALLDYDRETGVFRWRETRGGVRAGAVAGRVDANGYVEIGLDGRLIKAHRLAWIHARGWTKRASGPKPYQVMCGDKYVGCFATEHEARSAYLSALEFHVSSSA